MRTIELRMVGLFCLAATGCAEPDPCASVVCDEGEQSCVAGTCVDSCGDMSALGPALSPDLTVIGSFCRSASTFGTHVNGSTFTVFDVTSTPTATGSTLTLSFWDGATFGTPTPTEAGTVSVAHASDALLFVGGYLTVSPDGSTGAFGYTLSSDGAPGETIAMTRAGVASRLDAPGNFDAVFAGDSLLVNGLGLGAESGPGVYASSAAPGGSVEVAVASFAPLSSSGSLHVTDQYVLIGMFLPDFSNALFAVPRTEIDGAIDATRAALDVATEGVRSAQAENVSSAFVVVNDQIVVTSYDAAFMLTGLNAYPISGYTAAGGVSVGAPVAITTGSAFDQAYPAPGGRMLLRFNGGLLLVE